MARSGVRGYVRELTACEPDGCGAQPGQPCMAYVQKKGKTTGKPTGDVHAARWRAFRARLNGYEREKQEEKDMEAEAGSSAAASTDLVQISVLRDRIDSAME